MTKLRYALLISLLAACATTTDDPAGPTWDDFKASATTVVDGEEIYTVEGDLPATLDELRRYYDENIAPV